MHISRFSLPSSTNSIISKSIRLFAFFRQEHDMENSRNSIHHLKITEWSLLVNKRNQKRHLNIQVSAWRGRQVTRLLSANAWQKETVKEGRGRQEGGGRREERRQERRKEGWHGGRSGMGKRVKTSPFSRSFQWNVSRRLVLQMTRFNQWWMAAVRRKRPPKLVPRFR